ncbi:MAG: hypothetical protein WAU32_07385 [Thermoanaerobaculia bacterium]
MKRHTLSIALVSAVFCLLLSVAPAMRADDDNRGCTYRTVSGDWGYTSAGTRIGVGAIAAVGSFTLDKGGNVLDGKQTVSFNGVIADETFSGKYSLNDDCTASAVVVVASPIAPRTSHLDLVFISDSNGVRMLFTDAGTILTVDGKKEH